MTTISKKIVYPDADGQPMAENTLQFEWITTLKSNLDWLFRDEPNVFVAGGLLWYPVEGKPGVRVAPDVLVACGRPKGYRGSYRQWEEGNMPLTVVIEVLSPGNRHGEMIQKHRFYERYGVEEYYVIGPEPVGEESISVFVRVGDKLLPTEIGDYWVSPCLGVRVDLTDGLRFYHLDGQPFLTFEQVSQRAKEQTQLAAEQAQRAEAAQQALERERAEKEAALKELADLRARLRGEDPTT